MEELATSITEDFIFLIAILFLMGLMVAIAKIKESIHNYLKNLNNLDCNKEDYPVLFSEEENKNNEKKNNKK